MKKLIDIHAEAVELGGMLRGVDLMANEGKMFDGPRIAITSVAMRMAETLADDLEKLGDATNG